MMETKGLKPEGLKLEKVKRPASVDSGIGLETPDRALSPVSSIGSTPSRASTPQLAGAVSPRWVNAVHVWILAELNRKAAEERKLSQCEDDMLVSGIKYQDAIALKNASYKPAKVGLFRAVGSLQTCEEAIAYDVDATEKLRSAATETRIVTTVFEISEGGIKSLLAELEEEMYQWFADQGSLVICCELVWSVPGRQRDFASEAQLKTDILRSLRFNNRRVLDLSFAENRDTYPICLPESTTEEVSGKEKMLGTYRGVYRRYYNDLLSYGHKETATEHKAYWEMDRNNLRPNPENFLMGNNREITELKTVCLVAINFVTLKLRNKM